jgi:hypothetical protein
MTIDQINLLIVTNANDDWGDIPTGRVRVGQALDMRLHVGIIIAAADVEAFFLNEGGGGYIKTCAVFALETVKAFVS